jgi:hypothetical protein
MNVTIARAEAAPGAPGARAAPRRWRARCRAQGKRMQVALRTLVVVGVGMIAGDGVLTPSISVLSSIEGLAVAVPGNPSLQKGQRARAPRCADLRRWLVAAVWQ